MKINSKFSMKKELAMQGAPKTTLGMHPKKFAMWLFMVSVVMLFAALTSAYIVRQAEGDWFLFKLPSMFNYSTVVILLSSVTMHWAYFSAKKDNLVAVRTAIILTSILGALFVIMQFFGWKEMVEMNVYFVGNPSGSFVYVITGVHAVHLISAVVFLFIMLIAAFRFEIHSRKLVSIEMCATYWHFLDALWIYLFIFMLLNR